MYTASTGQTGQKLGQTQYSQCVLSGKLGIAEASFARNVREVQTPGSKHLTWPQANFKLALVVAQAATLTLTFSGLRVASSPMSNGLDHLAWKTSFSTSNRSSCKHGKGGIAMICDEDGDQ